MGKDMNVELDEEKLSRLNAAGIINITLENLWRDCYSAMVRGDLVTWNRKLDAVWCLLCGDVKEGEIDDIINYKKPCLNNGTYCSAAAVCNYTIFAPPDNTLLIDNERATNQVAYHNITFTTTEIGIYQVDMVCQDGTLNGAETLYFEITGSGFNDTFGFYILVLVFSIGIMVLGFWKQDAPIVILGSFGLYFLGLYILFNGLAGFRDPVYTYSSGIITLFVAAYISGKSAYELITG